MLCNSPQRLVESFNLRYFTLSVIFHTVVDICPYQMDFEYPIPVGPSINYVSSNSSQALSIRSSIDVAAAAVANLATGAVVHIRDLAMDVRSRTPEPTVGRDLLEHGVNVVECDREDREEAEGEGRGDVGRRRARARAARTPAADMIG